jgi:hypothetical protein
MITFLEGFKYLAAGVVALSVPGFGLVALTFLMFWDHAPFFMCFLRMALTGGIAIAQVVILVKAWTLLKQRQHPRLSAGLMILSILPVPLAIVIYMRIPAWPDRGLMRPVLHPARAAFRKESRMRCANATKLHRKSGRGPSFFFFL